MSKSRMTDRPEYWNHNTAYYPWIRKKVRNCHSVLDAGCGDGSLILYLDDGKKELYGIDPNESCVTRALSKKRQNMEFSCCRFEDDSPKKTFDAILFVASIHHMNMHQALQKAKTLLSPNGKILIVGLVRPSAPADYVREALRVIPSGLLSFLHRMRSAEELNLPANYAFPAMSEVRRIVKKELPNARIHYGLHYRFLAEYEDGQISVCRQE